jgi:hypothetical protein
MAAHHGHVIRTRNVFPSAFSVHTVILSKNVSVLHEIL